MPPKNECLCGHQDSFQHDVSMRQHRKQGGNQKHHQAAQGAKAISKRRDLAHEKNNRVLLSSGLPAHLSLFLMTNRNPFGEKEALGRLISPL